ncbi:hypothetical protein GEMRC1_003060 [Eukaryota sp. GEM-RC1]
MEVTTKVQRYILTVYITLAIHVIAQYLLSVLVIEKTDYDILAVTLIPLAALFAISIAVMVLFKAQQRWLQVSFFLYAFIIVVELSLLVFITTRIFTPILLYTNIFGILFTLVSFHSLYSLFWTPLLDRQFEKIIAEKRSILTLTVDEDHAVPWTFATNVLARKARYSKVLFSSVFSPVALIAASIITISSDFSMSALEQLSLIIACWFGLISITEGCLVFVSFGRYLKMLHEKRNIKNGIPKFVKSLIIYDYFFRFPLMFILSSMFILFVFFKIFKVYDSFPSAHQLLDSYNQVFITLNNITDAVKLLLRAVFAGVLGYPIVAFLDRENIHTFFKFLATVLSVFVIVILGLPFFDSMVIFVSLPLYFDYHFGFVSRCFIEIMVVLFGNMIGLCIAMYLFLDKSQTDDVATGDCYQEMV